MAKKSLSVRSEDYFLTSTDGESEIYVRHFGSSRPQLHFLMVHGALEHSGRHIELIEFLLNSFRQTVAVTVYDNVGHGRSGGTRAYVPHFNIYVEDLGKVGEFIQEKNSPQTKTFILAHSLGGLISLTRILDPKYGWHYPLEGIILSSPCIRPKMAFGESSESILESLDKLLGKLRLPMIYRGRDLTRDSEKANEFDLDNLIPRFITVRMAKEIIEASHRIRGQSFYLEVPVLFLIAGSDKIVDSESTELFAMGVDKHLSQVIHYPKHYHELWNEVDRQQIFETMKKWIERLLKGRP